MCSSPSSDSAVAVGGGSTRSGQGVGGGVGGGVGVGGQVSGGGGGGQVSGDDEAVVVAVVVVVAVSIVVVAVAALDFVFDDPARLRSRRTASCTSLSAENRLSSRARRTTRSAGGKSARARTARAKRAAAGGATQGGTAAPACQVTMPGARCAKETRTDARYASAGHRSGGSARTSVSYWETAAPWAEVSGGAAAMRSSSRRMARCDSSVLDGP
mmetsp:Transcript_104/g.296  ORF Transcript_104/g.296 Transcript_104/m.296 type:complete len:214 (+) Transcript_104:972-1613(+)